MTFMDELGVGLFSNTPSNNSPKFIVYNSRLFFVFHEEFANDHIYEKDSLSDMHGLCEGSIFLQLHSSYLFGSLTCFFNCLYIYIYLGIVKLCGA